MQYDESDRVNLGEEDGIDKGARTQSALDGTCWCWLCESGFLRDASFVQRKIRIDASSGRPVGSMLEMGALAGFMLKDSNAEKQ